MLPEKSMRIALPIAALLGILLLAGCASRATRAMQNSPDYKAGYSDGCDSAGAQGANPRANSLTRDEAAYASSAAYRSGWGAGFGTCRAMLAPPPSPGGLGMPRSP